MDFAQVAQVLSDPALRTMSPTDRELFLGEMQQLIQVLEEHHIELADSGAELESSDALPANKTALVIKYLAQWTRHVSETGVNERPLTVAHFVTWLKQHTRATDAVPVSGVKRARDSSDEDEDDEWTRHHASSDVTRVKRPRVSPSVGTSAVPVSVEASAVQSPSGAEKRLSRYRSAPSKALLERIDLARQQRHCLVQHVSESALDHSYQVLAQGTVYTVKVGHIPTCNCANASRGIHCTHLLFVLLKVLRVLANDPVLYQRSLLTSELTKIYAQSSEHAPHCVICYETAADPSDQLRECHAQSRDCLVHEPCLVKYKQARADLSLPVLCPHCEFAL